MVQCLMSDSYDWQHTIIVTFPRCHYKSKSKPYFAKESSQCISNDLSHFWQADIWCSLSSFKYSYIDKHHNRELTKYTNAIYVLTNSVITFSFIIKTKPMLLNGSHYKIHWQSQKMAEIKICWLRYKQVAWRQFLKVSLTLSNPWRLVVPSGEYW